LQAKLLRVLEDKEFYRLGSRHTVKVNVRIVSASNRNLEKLVAKRLFREDLYYRLNVFRITLPELKDRRVDLALLIGHILRRLSAASGNRLPEVSEKVMEILLNYRYPGNVRELENILEHAMIICQEETIQITHLPEYLQGRSGVRKAIPSGSTGASTGAGSQPENTEHAGLLAALRQFDWHRQKTARALGVDRTTLWRKMKKYGLLD
jgi:transcriptional regulator with PAS, ATPase and Fis domain